MTRRFTPLRCWKRTLTMFHQQLLFNDWTESSPMSSKTLARRINQSGIVIPAKGEDWDELFSEIADRLIQRWRSQGLIKRISVNRMLGWKVNTTKP